MKNLIISLCIISFLGCHTLPDRKSTDIVRRTISVGDTLIYSLGSFHQSERALIHKQARHAAISTLDQDSSNMEIFYYYVPLPNYSGEDFVEMHALRADDENPGSSHTIITEMTVVVNE